MFNRNNKIVCKQDRNFFLQILDLLLCCAHCLKAKQITNQILKFSSVPVCVCKCAQNKRVLWPNIKIS